MVRRSCSRLRRTARTIAANAARAVAVLLACLACATLVRAIATALAEALLSRGVLGGGVGGGTSRPIGGVGGGVGGWKRSGIISRRCRGEIRWVACGRSSGIIGRSRSGQLCGCLGGPHFSAVFDGGNDDVGDITVGRDIGHVPAEPACESCDEIGSAENASHDLSFTLAAIVSLGLDGSSDLEFGKTAGGRDILNVDPCAGLELGGEDLENLDEDAQEQVAMARSLQEEEDPEKAMDRKAEALNMSRTQLAAAQNAVATMMEAVSTRMGEKHWADQMNEDMARYDPRVKLLLDKEKAQGSGLQRNNEEAPGQEGQAQEQGSPVQEQGSPEPQSTDSRCPLGDCE